MSDDPGNDSTDLVAILEAFIRDNPDLERLEGIASDFNPFVAMRWTRQELRHSAFLRWFLDPAESHGLGAYPLRNFLKAAVGSGDGGAATPTLVDVDGWSLTTTRAFAEWEQIDVLLRNDEDGFVVVVENKVDTTEHSQQLLRYRELIEAEFPSHEHLFVYLNPAGDQPSDDAYVAMSYSLLADLVDKVVERRGTQTSEDVIGFLRYYSEMVRRHIVEDSEVQELCRRIYDNHRQALDLIFEYRPDRAQEISNLLQKLAEAHGAVMDQSSKSYVRFTTEGLDELPTVGEGWTSTGRMLLFEFANSDEKVFLKLLLGPGPDDIRSAIHEHVQDHKEIFNRAHYKFYPKWWTFRGSKWITKKQYSELSLEELEQILRERMEKLFTEDIPKIESTLAPVIEDIREERAVD